MESAYENRSASFILGFCVAVVIYLVLTAGSGTLFFWSLEELFLAIVSGIIAGLVAMVFLSRLAIEPSLKFFNPIRWFLFIIYIVGPFFFSMAKANIDVAYRVVTGKVKPGIVVIEPKLRSDFGITMLANSITLTPGTLTVDAEDGKLFIHWLNVKSPKPKLSDVCSSFVSWIRRIAE